MAPALPRRLLLAAPLQAAFMQAANAADAPTDARFGALAPDARFNTLAPDARFNALAPDAPGLQFGPGFKFGVSSSAYQIEGAVAEDGRGPGIWDVFCRTPGRIARGGNADTSCDHYHRMPQDVALIAKAGLRNYRFSVSWPRLFADGYGRANPQGFAFYDRLLDELHAHNIAAWICLYHWDLPQALQDKGGWTNRDTAFRLAEFVHKVSQRYRTRAAGWMVMNEATVQANFGYGTATHAPGMRGKHNWFAALHHMNLGQGLAVQALRANQVTGKIGTVVSAEPVVPSSNNEADIKAAEMFDAVWNGAVLQPLFKGSYPALVATDFEALVKPRDMADIQQKIDVLGVNYYSRLHIQADQASPIGANFGPVHVAGHFKAAGWPIEPGGMYEILTRLHAEYRPDEIIITENGFATADDSKLPPAQDQGRIEYLADNLMFVKKAVAAGVPVGGYFVWGLLDGFEWNAGMKWRFGLVQVDFKTFKRTPKNSYYWYAELVRQNIGLTSNRTVRTDAG